MPTYLEIAVNVPQVSGVFHYHLPPELEGRVGAGHLVEVPFGKQQVQGVVLRAVSEPAVARTKPVLQLLDPEVVLTRAQLALAEHLTESTLAPLSACINLMIPPGLSQLADSLYTPVERAPGGDLEELARRFELSPAQRRLMALLEKRGPLRGRQIARALPRRNWRATAQALVRMGLISGELILPAPSVQPKSVRTAQLAVSPKQAAAELPELGRAGSKALARRQAMLRFLMRERGPVNVSWVYAESGGSLADLRKLAERGLVILGQDEVWRDPLENMDFTPSEPPPLTHDQRAAWEPVRAALALAAEGQELPPFLLHGVTGSGKTEIYLHAVQAALGYGKQAIVLVPEIALTPQTVRRFQSRFPGRVGLMHSGLSAGERYDTWRRARQGELDVIVGPRSALFAPLPRLGLIVVDESHDDSYYQGESLPYYHARSAAVAYARLIGGVCLLGSATPDIVSQFQARQGRWRYLHLPARILAHRQAVEAQLKRLALNPQVSRYRPLELEAESADLPEVRVVDMRGELKAGNTSIFSRALHAALEEVLQNEQQAILFLNRRGSATYVFCRDCGYTLKCPRCGNPLIFHRSAEALTCHHCGYQRRMPGRCPNCRSQRIRQYGMGTERVEAEIRARFPGVRTLRWDYDTTRKKDAHDAILRNFSAHGADLLIGTQMLAKGLDLPLVTLVGVVLADVGLNLPDYRAAERTFQVLTQVAGRAGRSPLGGQVILQTFDPDHYVIQAASRHAYRDFYRQEIGYRRELGYPPFNQLVRLEYRHTQNDQAEGASVRLAAQLRAWIEGAGRRATSLIGPVPCFFSRLAGEFRWQIILRGPDPAGLLRGRLPDGWRVEVNPPSLL